MAIERLWRESTRAVEILAETDDFRRQFCQPFLRTIIPLNRGDHLWTTGDEVFSPRDLLFALATKKADPSIRFKFLDVLGTAAAD